MWNEIKAVWKKQWQSAKDAWKCTWNGAKDAICNAIYAIANFFWAIIQTVIFLPIKTGLYETGKIIFNHIINWFLKI